MKKLIERIYRDLENYPKSKIEQHIKIKNTIPNIYKPINSLIQMSTIYNEYKNNPHLLYQYYYGLILLLNKYYIYLNPENIEPILHKKDNIIFQALIKMNKGEKKKIIFYNTVLNAQIRNEILSEFKGQIKNYLDIGCGNCKKTQLTGKRLGLSYKNIYGADIVNWEEAYDKNSRKHLKINFVPLKLKDKLPFKDNFFSLISFDEVLHHAGNYKILLQESHRILKNNGLLLIKEHDIVTTFDFMLVDIQHSIFRSYDLKKTKSSGHYKNWIEWNYIITESGFKLLKLLEDRKYYNPIENVTRTYYAIYQKL